MRPLIAASFRLKGLRGDQDGSWWWNVYDIVVCDPLGSLALGLTTLGMMFTAIGLLFSSLSRHQVAAALGTFAVLFLLVVGSFWASVVAAQGRSSWAE